MEEKLSQIEQRYEKLTDYMNAPEAYSDPAKYARLAREEKELSAVVEAWREVKRLRAGIGEARALLDGEDDGELRALAKEELAAAEAALPPAEEELKRLLLPKDPND